VVRFITLVSTSVQICLRVCHAADKMTGLRRRDFYTSCRYLSRNAWDESQKHSTRPSLVRLLIASGPKVHGRGSRPMGLPQVFEYWRVLDFENYSRNLLPRDAMLARYMLPSCVCSSVVRHKPALHQKVKHKITQTTPYDSTGTLVFWLLKSRRNSNGRTPNGASNRAG